MQLKRVFGLTDGDFTEIDEGRFCSWYNGHCFLWELKGGDWECEEL